MTDIIVQTADTVTVSNSGTVTQESGGDITQNYGASVSSTVTVSPVTAFVTNAAITAGDSTVAPSTNFHSDLVGQYVLCGSGTTAEICTIDSVSGLSPADGGNFANSHSSGVSIRPIFDGFVNVAWFGAKGDGTTNDATAIQAAIDEAAAYGFGVRFGRGQFRIGSTLELKSGLAGLIGSGGLLQSGTQASVILVATASDNAIENNTGSRLYNVYLKDLGFDTVSGVTGGIALYLKDCGDFKIVDVTVKREVGNGYDTSLKIEGTTGNGAHYNQFRGCTFRQKASPTTPNIIITSTSSGPGANSNYFLGGSYQGYGSGTSNPNVKIEYSDNIAFMACALEGGYEYGIATLGAALWIVKTQAFGCRFESSNGSPKSVDFDQYTEQSLILGNTYTSSFTFSDAGQFNIVEESSQINFNRKNVVTDGSNAAFIVDRNTTTPFGSTYASDDAFSVYGTSGSRTLRIRNNGALTWGSSDDIDIRKISTGLIGMTAGVWRMVWENASTGSRPGSPVTGQCYFDTTLGQPVWYDGSNWVDATGTTA